MSEAAEAVRHLIENRPFGRSWTRNTKAPLKLTDKIKIGDGDHATHKRHPAGRRKRDRAKMIIADVCKAKPPVGGFIPSGILPGSV
jgi:hypothetical protein